MNRLQAVAGQPGLWKNQDWTPGQPGAFVVLIGVSAYTHLAGGAGPLAARNYDLEQLHVSAYTAYELFNWVKNQYRFTPPSELACPVAQCWLLLSPTQEELSVIDPSVSNHLLEPTFQNIQRVVRHWYQSMDQLPKPIAETSRSLFFFSGHGLEIFDDEQILIPSDWLNTDGDENDAVNVRRLARALSRLWVGDQYFFVDACRNDNEDLRKLDIKGNGMVTAASTSSLTNPACNGPILCASAAGTETFQPRHVREGCSLFGRALLDGLCGREGFQPDCVPSLCSVKFSSLHEFIINRYNQLLRQFGESLTQHIPLTGKLTKPSGVVTHLAPTGQPTAAPQDVYQVKDQAYTTRLAVALDPRLGFAGDDFQFLNRSHPDYHSFNFSPRQPPVGEPIQDDPARWATNQESLFLSAQDVFAQDELVSAWNSLRLYSLDTQSWLNPLRVALHQVERTQNNRTYRLTISLPRITGRYWLEFDFNRLTYAFVLPGDRLYKEVYAYVEEDLPRPIFYALELVLSSFESGLPVRLRRTSASISSFNQSWLLRQMVPIWEKYTSGMAIRALEEIEANHLRDIVIEKADSPTAAMMATLVLLRAYRTDLLKPRWMENLTNWFSRQPDGPVLMNEYWLRHNTSGVDASELIKNLLIMDRRGLPYLSEVFGFAIRQVDDLLELDSLSRRHRAALLRIQKRFRRALRYFMPGGLYTSFVGKKRSISPALLKASASSKQEIPNASQRRSE